MSHAILPEALETLRTPLGKVRPECTNPKLLTVLRLTLNSIRHKKSPRKGLALYLFRQLVGDQRAVNETPIWTHFGEKFLRKVC